jgi:DNA-binding beta-propeller fold protein YncE
MRIVVTSASGANGDGYGAMLSFNSVGELIGPIGADPRIADPRGMSLDPSRTLLYMNSADDRVLAIDLHGASCDSGPIHALDPGGGAFGPDCRYYLTVRRRRTILAMPAELDRRGDSVLPDGIVPFPRGFGFARDRQLYLASGVGPNGEGDKAILVFKPETNVRAPRVVGDPELSPLDLAVAPNGNIVVSSEWPFGDPNAVATVREYEPTTGRLIRILAPDRRVRFRRPRGLRFGPNGRLLYWVGADHVLAFDFTTGRFLGRVVHLPRLHGQALVLVS